MRATLPSLRRLSPKLTHHVLYERLLETLTFARRNLAQLNRSEPIWSEELDPYINEADKVIIESALLALLASRPPSPAPIRAALGDLTELLSPLIRNDKNLALLLRYPHTAAALGIGHYALTALGDDDDEFDSVLRRSLDCCHVDAVERVPYRSMDVRWLRGIVAANGCPRFDDIVPLSMLGGCPHPIQMSAADTYALTHALMYLSDFGTRPLPATFDARLTRATVDAALALHLVSENLDLLGELLMVAALLGRSWSPYARLGWTLLVEVWDGLGFLPSPTFESAAYVRLTEREQTSYAFRHLYHTTYVAGILCSILLRHPEEDGDDEPLEDDPVSDPDLLARCEHAVDAAMGYCQRESRGAETLRLVTPAPPANAAAETDGVETALTSVVERLQRYPGPFGRPDALWVRALASAPLSRAEALQVLTDTLLIQAARDYQLELLDAGLREAARSLPVVTPTLAEATAFVIRQQLPDGAVGAFNADNERQDPAAVSEATARFAVCLTLVAERLGSGAAPPSPQAG